MGEIYRANDTRLDRVVAVKVLASHLSSSPELKRRMESHARSISSLNLPNIWHLYDVGLRIVLQKPGFCRRGNCCSRYRSAKS